ncbi:MAG: plastocyanin/azurin family copper-binding protein, partial [Thermoplasmata archaeon]
TLNIVNLGGPHTFTLFDDVNADIPKEIGALQIYYNTHVRLVDLNFSAGQQRSHTFTAPAVEGDYPFVCMEPGHAALDMFGTMTVTSETPEEPSGTDPLLIGIVVAVVVIVIAVAAVFLLRRRS